MRYLLAGLLLAATLTACNCTWAANTYYRCPLPEQLHYMPAPHHQWLVSAYAHVSGATLNPLKMLGDANSKQPAKLTYSEMLYTDGYKEFLCNYETVDVNGREVDFYIAEEDLTHMLDQCMLEPGPYYNCDETQHRCTLSCLITTGPKSSFERGALSPPENTPQGSH